ncbi:hypothetical protein GCM10009859_00520 [Kocuria salsicia]
MGTGQKYTRPRALGNPRTRPGGLPRAVTLRQAGGGTSRGRACDGRYCTVRALN